MEQAGHRGVYWAFFLVFFGLLFWERDVARTFYVLQIVLCILLETILFFRQVYRPSYRWFWVCWGSFLLGYALWLLDVKHLACDPSNHWVSGHALWHWLDALALYCVYRFYTGIPVLRFDAASTTAPAQLARPGL